MDVLSTQQFKGPLKIPAARESGWEGIWKRHIILLLPWPPLPQSHKQVLEKE